MTSRAEAHKRQVALYRKLEASSAPRKKKIEMPIGLWGKLDKRLDKARTAIALLEGWMEVAEEQEARRFAGLSWAPLERYRDVEHAAILLNELVADMRSET